MNKIFMLGVLLLSALPSFACDQCGCGLLLGVQPKDHATNFGLQWRMRYLNGDILAPAAPVPVAKHGDAHGAAASGPANYTEMYAVLEARAQIWLGQRTSVTASLPLLNNFQAVDGIRHADIYGVGDPIVLLRYVILGSLSGPDTTRLRHRLTAGIGMKLPLGRTDVMQFGQLLDHDLQPGTGTWDEMLSVEYMVRGRTWGTSIGAMGRYNGETEHGHRMGHSASLLAEVFRNFPLDGMQFLPSIGAYVEAAMPDRMNDVPDESTGGTTVFSHVSARLWLNSWGLSCAWQHALINDLGALMIPNRERIVVGLTYSLDKD